MKSLSILTIVVMITGCSASSDNQTGKSTPSEKSAATNEGKTAQKPELNLTDKTQDGPEKFDNSDSAGPPETTKKVDKYKVVKTGSKLSLKEAQAILDYHNKVRADVKVEKMTWSPTLGAWAQQWADSLNAMGCKFKHRSPNKYGENLYMGSAHAFDGVSGVKSWESEKKYYSGGKLTSGNWYKSGHYTQIVWRKTTEVGCASTVCRGMMILVCNYNPPGNFMGQKPY